MRQRRSAQLGIATLEAALFIGIVFLPLFVGAVELWSYFTLVTQVTDEVARLRTEISTINLQMHTGIRGTFPRERKANEKDPNSAFTPYETYSKTARDLAHFISSMHGVEKVNVEVGYLSARLLPSNGVPLLQDFGTFEEKQTGKTPQECNRWKQPGSTSTLVICSESERLSSYENSSLWSLLRHNLISEHDLSRRTPFIGRAWSAHAHRRLQRPLGSSVWLSEMTREGQDAPNSLDGNDYAWLDHPRFSVLSGYVVTVTVDSALFSLFQQTTEPTISFFGTLPVKQEL